MKKILVLDHTAKPSGGELYLLDVLRHIHKEKFKVKVVLGERGHLEDKLVDAGVDVSVMPLPKSLIEYRREEYKPSNIGSMIGFGLYALKIAGIIAANKIDVVYTNSIKSDVYGSIAARLTGRPCVWFLHDRVSPDYFTQSLCDKIIKFANKYPKRIICNSVATKLAFTIAGGDEAKARVVLNGVDLDRFKMRKDPDNKIKKVALVGRISAWKGQRVFIEAADEVLRDRDDVEFLIAGSVLFEEEDYKKDIEELIEAFNIKDKVKFLDFVPDIREFLQGIDIMAHCSIIPEPFGLSVAEAMASGVPVVASRAGGIVEMVEDEASGLLYPPGNYKELADRLNRLLDDSDLRKRVAVNARKTIEMRFDIKEAARKIEEILLSL